MGVVQELERLENEKKRLEQRLAEIDIEMRKLRQADCNVCGGKKSIALSAGMYGAGREIKPCPACLP